MEALFKPYRIIEAQLGSIPVVDGQIIFAYDTKKVYLDIDNVRTLALENTTYSIATELADGLMSAKDKAKLDSLSDWSGSEGGCNCNIDMQVEGNTLFIKFNRPDQTIIIEISIVEDEILSITSSTDNIQVLDDEGILSIAIEGINTNVTMSIVDDTILDIVT